MRHTKRQDIILQIIMACELLSAYILASICAKDLKLEENCGLTRQDELERIISLMLPKEEEDVNSTHTDDSGNQRGQRNNKPKILLSFKYTDSPSSVEMSIEERLFSHISGAIVKVLWRDILIPRQETPANKTLLNMLGQSFNHVRLQLSKLEERNTLLTKCVSEWQETATTFEREKESLQNELMENFLVLLNQTKEKLRSALSELEQEKQKYNRLLEDQPTKLSSHKTKPLREDSDQEEEMFDSSIVHHLAAGESTISVLKQKDELALSLKRKTEGNSTLFIECEPLANVDTKRVNPLSGTVELWGSKALLKEQVHNVNQKQESVKKIKLLVAGKPESATPAIAENVLLKIDSNACNQEENYESDISVELL